MTARRVRQALVAGACLILLGTVSGCGSNRAADVGQVASRFYDAVSGQDGPGACALLAPPTRSAVEQSAKKPCAGAIVAAGLHPPSSIETVSVYGTMAQVTWGTDVTFLTRYEEGWRVLAAGCSMPPASQRTAAHYDCTVEAG
jgi:hypothetical protein